MPDEILLRFAGPDDASAIEDVETRADALLIEALRPESWPDVEPGTARLAAHGFVLLADSGTEVVGFAHVLEIDGHAHLEQLAVLPEYGRRGIGRALVDAAIETARGRGHTRMTLRTFADVPWNAPFYRSCGFVEEEPDSDFLRELVDVERRLGLLEIAPRVQLSRTL
ncbi:GNAT family N-acetyltransferase [Microbacterium gorillae]|uniref:GNAT family N-acetyltransferase n=1 Tax=Microbacterium gorillae TaxID=1231063 RepID=UPI00058DE959|nr:GNAT family N-acetyltransferase [Microbacterium gorillae]